MSELLALADASGAPPAVWVADGNGDADNAGDDRTVGRTVAAKM